MDHQTVAPPMPDKPLTSRVDSGSGKRFKKKAKLRLFQGKLISYHIHWMAKKCLAKRNSNTQNATINSPTTAVAMRVANVRDQTPVCRSCMDASVTEKTNNNLSQLERSGTEGIITPRQHASPQPAQPAAPVYPIYRSPCNRASSSAHSVSLKEIGTTVYAPTCGMGLEPRTKSTSTLFGLV